MSEPMAAHHSAYAASLRRGDRHARHVSNLEVASVPRTRASHFNEKSRLMLFKSWLDCASTNVVRSSLLKRSA